MIPGNSGESPLIEEFKGMCGCIYVCVCVCMCVYVYDSICVSQYVCIYVSI
jgi:hypothetical protein